ncbi:CRISPR-associated endonuclease Cas2 [Oceanidesulfovibrio marinus]|uniref:CRISPR-associated endoribonuclease Cas2 n=1 Tax=Oceanidesulfovibrio marinus TaxID=370038 RepID=A0A6P1Z9T9_9BACT|nr:CRISPR-associated endonuclease Cas2 [Oceanidesulfovibrio marinus]TVM30253.1 CRISPR-associated endonuclease Cas2 [Oceanidesulfovibrio marinus]
MLMLVSYDVATSDEGGPKRLRQVAKLCGDYGQRVQYSVFECDVDPAQWATLRASLLDVIKPDKDSLRFYNLGREWKRRVEHVGVREPPQLDEPLII